MNDKPTDDSKEPTDSSMDSLYEGMADGAAVIGPKHLTQFVFESLLAQGACAVGVSTKETLAGGPPSTDLEYILPGAKSAVTFAVPFDQTKIDPYLGKEDFLGHNADNFTKNAISTGLSHQMAGYFKLIGHPSRGVMANGSYREDTPNGIADYLPDLSHRLLAVRSGVGWFGVSGNVITKDYGGAVVLGTFVTTAELEPTEPLPPEESFCEGCKICRAICAGGTIDTDEKDTVTMGGVEISKVKFRNYHRCDLVCGGLTGLAKNGKWSTWSPGRFEIPDDDDGVMMTMIEALMASAARPSIPGTFSVPMIPAPMAIVTTCGNCGLVCHPDPEVRKHRYKLLTKSGVVVQNPDGSLKAMTPEDAAKHLSEMSPEQRTAYEKV